MNFEPMCYYTEDYERLFSYYEYDGCIWYSYDDVMDKLGINNNQKSRLWNKYI